MNELLKILVIGLGIAILDIPWLYGQGPWVQEIIRDIQAGRSMNPRLLAGVPVYLALGYLVTQQISAPRAFLTGLCVYAVYDFTMMVTFDQYPITFAVVDSLWGGLLMALASWLSHRAGLVAVYK